MVASTIATDLETTHVRRRKRANQCRCRLIVARSSVALAALRLVPGSGPGQALADVMAPDRQGLVVRCVVVGAKQPHTPARQALEQALKGGLVAIATFPVDQPAGAALVGLPDPELGGFF